MSLFCLGSQSSATSFLKVMAVIPFFGISFNSFLSISSRSQSWSQADAASCLAWQVSRAFSVLTFSSEVGRSSKTLFINTVPLNTS